MVTEFRFHQHDKVGQQSKNEFAPLEMGKRNNPMNTTDQLNDRCYDGEERKQNGVREAVEKAGRIPWSLTYGVRSAVFE